MLREYIISEAINALKIEVTDKVKEGIVFTTFHFPEHMVNMVTGHGKDEETMCAEYKVSSVETVSYTHLTLPTKA